MSISSLATMSRLRWLSGGTVAIALAFAALTALPARSADDGEATAAASVDHEEFVRIRKDDRNRPLAMQTAIQRYTKLDASGAPIVVDLIGVVHVGELDYYKVLNDRFAGYDALLYELVAPEGTRVNPDEARGGPVSGIQTGLKDMLGLEFQLDHIDYHQANFVHADMSPEEFVESMSANDESFMKMFFRAMGSSMAQQGTQGQSDGAMLAAMFSNDREMALRRQMAGQISNMDASMAAFGGENGSTIIHHRNGKCFEILDREIEAGNMLGVFYGRAPRRHGRATLGHGLRAREPTRVACRVAFDA
ncbi:MAG: hypothetical protein R3B96_24480 [Pirellulaceae bacterium]